jgi:hypothetical protein
MWSNPIRVNSANAIVSSAKYTPEMPKRNARNPIACTEQHANRDRKEDAGPCADSVMKYSPAAA